MARICVFGEPLLELIAADSDSVLGAAALGVAGDTLNTSVYLARLGHDVSFVSAVGVDSYSDAMLDRLDGEGVTTDKVLRHPTRVPGLYAIRTDSAGERYFTYWREQSAAKDFFSLANAEEAIGHAENCDLFYFSGISLSILPPDHREMLLSVARRCVANGVQVAFDGNYRPRGWPSSEAAKACFSDVAGIVSIVMPTSEDDDLLFGENSPQDHAARWVSSGAQVVVVKNGPDGAWVRDHTGTLEHVPVEQVIAPTDTTGAGDSFNAAFLASILDGKSAKVSAVMGNNLAATVIQHKGALIPSSDMPAVAS